MSKSLVSPQDWKKRRRGISKACRKRWQGTCTKVGSIGGPSIKLIKKKRGKGGRGTNRNRETKREGRSRERKRGGNRGFFSIIGVEGREPQKESPVVWRKKSGNGLIGAWSGQYERGGTPEGRRGREKG